MILWIDWSFWELRQSLGSPGSPKSAINLSLSAFKVAFMGNWRRELRHSKLDSKLGGSNFQKNNVLKKAMVLFHALES